MVYSMPRPRHRLKEYEAVLKRAEGKGWAVEGGGDKHFKLKCPNPCKCMLTMSTTPSNPNYLRNLLGQLGRVTCWKEDV